MRSTPSLLLLGLSAAPLVFFAARGAAGTVDPRRAQELSTDPSIAKVVDREGVAMARGAADERWRGADENVALFAGEWLKTGARGANALSVRLKNGATLILGPGALVELRDADSLHVSAGEVEIGASEASRVKASGPGGATLDLAATKAVRAADGKLVALDAEPRWLSGYKSGQSTEALGSLLATIDGRDVPLTLGYHKVTVDVRDQIARTLIEESFENHTNQVLEGVFYFPLPADASISSFGMWIGNELVEGDIVEKERARAIYEQILREKRDPGLLEWAGGNVFKARVYPIAAEKRIKIAYTQVLPRTGDVCSYHYALQSELLRTKPLRQLAIEVTVSSAEPLAAVASPSHDCRIRTTEHSAQVSFDAQEFSPDRGFELRIATKSPERAGGLTLVEDRRGDDGYFMLRFSAPQAARAAGGGGAAADGPTDWLILADTSGSMAGPARDAQIVFVEALLQSLSREDTIQLVTCDVEPRFAFEAPRACTDDARAEALRFLEARDALGWSDLAAAFGAAFSSAHDSTQIVYVGDGQPTLGDADPGKFALELPKLWRGQGRVHAVVPGATSEPIVLRALARLGGGSVRAIAGESDPTSTALALLEEVTTPSVSDLMVTFEGIAVAAVHPEVLPNLPAGKQQIVVGRFDPFGATKGRVKVTGTLGGETIEYTADVDLAPRGEQTSFIPRLWARHHLDSLLALGHSPETKARVIALSEEFQIATPYTSFLVLESEADRERFQVEKRMRMRDGEEFFAKGRADAAFELLREQMKKAGLWHRGLRDDVLAELSTLARDATERLRPALAQHGYFGPSDSAWGFEVSNEFLGIGGGGGGKPGSKKLAESEARTYGAATRGWRGDAGAPATAGAPRRELKELGYVDDAAGEEGESLRDAPGEPASDPESDEDELEDLAELDSESLVKDEAAAKSIAPNAPAARPSGSGGFLTGRTSLERKRAGLDRAGFQLGPPSPTYSAPFEFAARQQIGNFLYTEDYRAAPRSGLEGLFASIAKPSPEPRELPFGNDVRALLASLDRHAVLAALAGGVEFRLVSTSTDHRGRTRAAGSHRSLLAKDDWLTIGPHREGEQYFVNWLRGGQRGAWRADWSLGRVRDREAGDERSWPEPYSWSFGQTAEGYRDWTVTSRELDGGRVELTFVHPSSPESSQVVVIDRARSLVVEQRSMVRGEATSVTRFLDPVGKAGAWWPTRIESAGKDGRITQSTTVSVDVLDAAAFASRIDGELSKRPGLIEIGEPPKDLAAAKQAVADGSPRIEDRLLLLAGELARGEAEAAAPHLDALRGMTAGKAGFARLELAVLTRTRRNEELRLRLLAESAALAAGSRECELSIAGEYLQLASTLDAGSERLELLRALEPVHRRQAEIPEAAYSFEQQWLAALQAAGRSDDLLAAREKHARDWPEQIHAQLGWVSDLASRGELDAALAWLEQSRRDHGPWSDAEQDTFFAHRLQHLWNGYRLDDVITDVEARLRELPDRVQSGHLDQYLSAVVMLDREAQWWSTVARWLDEARGRVESGAKLSDGERARLEAALRQALGQGHSCWWHDRRFDPAEAEVIAAAARALLESEEHWHFANEALSHHSFRSTPAARALLAELYARVEAGVATLPAAALSRFVQVLRNAEFQTDDGDAGWQRILDGVFARFQATSDEIERTAFEGVLMSHGRRELVLDVLRHRLEIAPDEERRGVAAAVLLAALLQEKFTPELEDECLRLLPIVRVIVFPQIPEERLRGDAELARRVREAAEEAVLTARILAWFDFVTWAVEKRTDATVEALPDVNRMPRRKLAAARAEQTRLARIAVRDRLSALLAAPDPAHPAGWLDLDRIWLDVLLKEDAEAARARALELLRGVVEATNGRPDDELLVREEVLATRCVATLIHLLTRDQGDALAAHERELLAVTDAAQALDHPLLDWKEIDWARLVALDRGDALEAKLAEWFGGGDEFARMRYGRDLAWIRAERGKLEDAVRVMEQVAEKDELSHEDWMAVADWRTALDRKADAEAARLSAWVALDENELSQRVNQARWAAQNRGDGAPGTLDPVVGMQLVALMRKAQWPANYSWQIHSLYAQTKDFRVLECLADAVIGHSAQGVYGFLKQVAGMQGLIDEEATVDRVGAGIARVRERAVTDPDRRALDLLEFLSRWKASSQRNGGGPHAEAAAAAMRAAFSTPLAAGEARLLADFLERLGPLPAGELRTLQMRKLAEMVRAAATGSDERLAIAASLANVQWAAGEREAALRTLGSELDARRAASGGRLPEDANQPLLAFARYLQESGEWLRAEKLHLDEMAVAPNRARHRWFESHLHQLWAQALRKDGRVSLGEKRTLYDAAQAILIEKALARTNEGDALDHIQHLCGLWKAAHERKLFRVGDDVERFAFEDLPDVLDLYQHRSGQQMVGTVGGTLRETAGAAAAVEFLVTRAENEPHWLVRINQEFFDQHGWSLAHWRREAGSLDAKLERRLLALVTTELRAEMRHGESRARPICDQRWSNTFWSEKRGDFAAAVKAELRAGPDDEAVALRAADYLFHGVSHFDDAIDVLAARHRAGALGLDGQQVLCAYLIGRQRFGESLPILAGLIERRPEQLEPRLMRMRAFHGTRQREALEATRSATEASFRERKLWNEGVIAQLAETAFECELWDKCAGHFGEAIDLHVKSAPNRGVGDGTLSHWYGRQARAFANLGLTAQAVDAAAGAIVSWGNHIDQRREALAALESVLAQAEVLDEYVASFEAEVRETGLENPIVRRALGNVWRGRGAFEKAAAQYAVALEVEPDDVATHQALVETWDRLRQPERAIAQLFASLEVTGYDVALMRDLGRRLVRLGDAARAERVHTNLAEMLPHESESHQALAEIRAEQRRFADAADQWRQVIRIRSKEPTGYLGLARALLDAGDRKSAREPLERILGGEWEERFGDVKAEARSLLRQVGASF